LAALLVATCVSVLGGTMSLLAVPWFVYETTGDPLLTGVAALCETVPLIVLSFFAGAVVQRIGARRTRIWSDAISGAVVVAIPVLHATAGIAFWQLLVLVALNGALRAPAPAASLVLLAGASAARGLSIGATTGAYAASVRLATTVGAPLGGLLIAVMGAPSVLVVDAATFIISAVLVQRLVPTDVPPQSTAGVRVSAAPRVALGAGVAALRRDRTLALLGGAVVVLAVVEASWATVLAPVYGTQVLGSALVLGVLFGVLGAGATVGSLLHTRLATRLPRHPLLVAAVLLAGAPRFAVLAAAPPLVWLLLVVFVAGLAFGVLGPLWLAVQYERVPIDQQSHVFGVTFGLEQGGVALGALSGGLLLHVFSVTSALLVLSAVALTVAGTLAITRPLQPHVARARCSSPPRLP
jgi:predicted MFS family arabinose efflux permease